MVIPAHSLVEQMGGRWSLAAYYRSILMLLSLMSVFS